MAQLKAYGRAAAITATAAFLSAVMLNGVAGPAAAHHSFSMFDRTREIVLDGTLKSVEFTNPHSQFVLTAAGPDGHLKDWGVEGPSPNILIRMGWKRSDLSVGDHVTMTFNPLKDGAAGGVVVSIRLASGKVLSGMPPGVPKP